MHIQQSRTAVLLVGGHSTRMGVDKFAMNFNGRPQWEFMLESLGAFFDKVYIACRPDQIRHFQGPQLIVDELTDIGPMGALYSSFRQLEDADSIFFVACDLPHFDIRLAAKLYPRLSEKYDVVAAMNSERKSAEPLVAFWSRSALPLIEQFITEENYALFKCMSQLQVKSVLVGDSEALRNVNEPKDL